MASHSFSSYFSIEEGGDYDHIDESRLPYTQLRILGSGGCSVVDQVEDRNTGYTFARKVFVPKRRNQSWMKETFKNEVRIIRSLGDHHHIVRLFATYTTNGSLAMIMSPVADGGDLDKFLCHLKAYQWGPR
jgi:serine/threonine protein kinase